MAEVGRLAPVASSVSPGAAAGADDEADDWARSWKGNKTLGIVELIGLS